VIKACFFSPRHRTQPSECNVFFISFFGQVYIAIKRVKIKPISGAIVDPDEELGAVVPDPAAHV
jgi:hypothetical protein